MTAAAVTAAVLLFSYAGLFVADRARALLTAAGLDFVQIYAAFTAAQLDNEARSAQIEAASNEARAALITARNMLQVSQ
jgi:uncharacterized membrane protein